MIKCADCGSTQYDGTLFCSECGQSLLEAPVEPTNILPFSKASRRLTPPPLTGFKITSAPEAKKVTFVIPGSRQHLTVVLKERILIGRADFGGENAPDLDLTPHDGINKGVSREHASLQLSDQGIILRDLGSTNGTILNSSQLPPEQPFLLRSGDEVRFGDLLVHVFFEL
jgi:pSer/pThr/pTyr-binding forkhead associated (FHA) protein